MAFLTAILVAGMVVPLIVLGFVCWIFYRAKKREDAATREAGGTGWPSEPSS